MRFQEEQEFPLCYVNNMNHSARTNQQDEEEHCVPPRPWLTLSNVRNGKLFPSSQEFFHFLVVYCKPDVLDEWFPSWKSVHVTNA